MLDEAAYRASRPEVAHAATAAEALSELVAWAAERHGKKFLAGVAEDTDDLIVAATVWNAPNIALAVRKLKAALRGAKQVSAQRSRNALTFAGHHAAQKFLHEMIGRRTDYTTRQPYAFMPGHREYVLALVARLDAEHAPPPPPPPSTRNSSKSPHKES